MFAVPLTQSHGLYVRAMAALNKKTTDWHVSGQRTTHLAGPYCLLPGYCTDDHVNNFFCDQQLLGICQVYSQIHGHWSGQIPCLKTGDDGHDQRSEQEQDQDRSWDRTYSLWFLHACLSARLRRFGRFKPSDGLLFFSGSGHSCRNIEQPTNFNRSSCLAYSAAMKSYGLPF
jgi:hypothetical protein